MHIVLAILAALGAIAWFVIRANQVGRAGRELAETASDVKSLVRRSRWKSKTKGDPLKDIGDPRLAAAVMMQVIAKCDGDVTERQRLSILEQLRGSLRMDGGEAEEALGEARWLTQDLSDTATVLRRAAAPIEAACDEAERRQLVAMLETIAAVEGPPGDLQKNAIDGLKRKLGLAP